MTTVTESRPSGQMIAERIKIIDVDCHITEPADVWTARMSSKKWGDRIPHVREDPASGRPVWFINGEATGFFTSGADASWKKWDPSRPPGAGDVDPAAYDSHHRLKTMDAHGVYAEVLYPNVGGFGAQHFLLMKDPEAVIETVRAYNDFLVDWCSADPNRLLGIAMMPFWDTEECVREMERCKKNGLKGILFAGSPEKLGYPYHGDPSYEKVWYAAEDLQMPLHFHIASAGAADLFEGHENNGRQANFAKNGVRNFISNSKHVGEMIATGVCHRHPKLDIVSVESGIGWIPFYIEALEWQWFNSGVHKEHPEYDLSPREYFQRQIYGCFWFENDSAYYAIEAMGADNFLYETDFPHPTSMSGPGPASPYAQLPKDYVEDFFSRVSEENTYKILHGNAARLYHLND